jgi:YD repeat-containing protein
MRWTASSTGSVRSASRRATATTTSATCWGTTKAAGTPDARTTAYAYDLANRLVGITDPAGHSRSSTTDAVGNRLRTTEGNGGVTEFVYDALDRNIRIIDPLSFQTRLEYDGVGNRISITDARGGITRLTYDAGDRMVFVTDAEGRITKFAYDVPGQRGHADDGIRQSWKPGRRAISTMPKQPAASDRRLPAT